jgi:hypothetical protein
VIVDRRVRLSEDLRKVVRRVEADLDQQRSPPGGRKAWPENREGWASAHQSRGTSLGSVPKPTQKVGERVILLQVPSTLFFCRKRFYAFEKILHRLLRKPSSLLASDHSFRNLIAQYLHTPVLLCRSTTSPFKPDTFCCFINTIFA